MNDIQRRAADEVVDQLAGYLSALGYSGSGSVAPGLDREFATRLGSMLCTRGLGYDEYARVVGQLELLDGMPLPDGGGTFYLPPFVERVPTPRRYNELRTLGRCGSPSGGTGGGAAAASPQGASATALVALAAAAVGVVLYLRRRKS